VFWITEIGFPTQDGVFQGGLRVLLQLVKGWVDSGFLKRHSVGLEESGQ